MMHTRSRLRLGLSLAAALILLLLLAASAAADPPRPKRANEDTTDRAPLDLSAYQATRWVVQLSDPPLAQYKGGAGALKATAPDATGDSKLDVDKADSKAYAAYLQAKQQAFQGALAKAAPGATVVANYQTLVNGLGVKMSAAQAGAVRSLPGVAAVTPDRPHQLDMWSSLSLIGAPTLWNQLGGQGHAGDGIKVAVVDGGIYVKYAADGSYVGNACFNDTGYTMPAGYPKGDTRFTNKKVLAARAFFRPDDPPIADEDTPIPGTPQATSHGTHTAGTVACNAGTQATTAGVTETISGVAPRAWLLNYRVFYPSRNPDYSGNAFDIELIAALEAAVRDGADVISNSWGGSYVTTYPWPDPVIQAAEAAWDAGVVVVYSNGNAGPDAETTGTPATSSKLISVGASTKARSIASGFVDVTAPQPVPANLTGRPYGSAQFGPAITTLLGPTAYVPVKAVDTSGSSLACGDPSTTLPAGSLTGKIALIERGTCNFSLKVWNAQQAGAVAAIIYNSAAGGEGLITMAPGTHADDVTIPSVSVPRSMGLGMITLYTANPAEVRVQVDPTGREVDEVPDQIIAFSSRGPTTDKQIKPDIVAPGVNILSSGYGEGDNPFVGFGQVSGTSMACPHVAGAAALLRQLHPTWKPWQIKSALMTTAKEDLTNVDGSVAHVMDRGAGRIDLTKAFAPSAVVEPQSLSAGDTHAGDAKTWTVRVQDVSGSGGTWTLGVTQTGNVTTTTQFSVAVTPASVTLGPNASGSFQVRLASTATAAPGAYEGSVVLTNSATGTRLHMPVWLRVTPAATTADVLVIDDDGSSVPGAGLANYSRAYTETLTSLGVNYRYLDVGRAALPSLDTLYGYKAIVYFTGDNKSFATSGFTASDQNRLNQWLDSGGRMWASGQNLALTMDSDASNSAGYGRGRLYYGYLGLYWLAESLYSGAPPSPSADGVGPMAGLTLDLSGGNQTSIDLAKPAPNLDGYNAEETMATLFTARGNTTPAQAAIAFSRASEPMLEETRQKYGYRTITMNFGLEGVSGTGGTATRQQVARRALDWLLDSLTVSVSGTGAQYGATTLTAQATSSVGATITQYRWDFGDGSPTMTTTTPTVQHTFAGGGAQTVRVEVTDSLGHRAVASGTATVSPFQCDPSNPAQACNGLIVVRAFVDFGCDSFYNAGTDWPLMGSTLTAYLPDGTTRTAVVDMNGNAIFTGINFPAGYSVRLKAEVVPPTWVQQSGFTLSPCLGTSEATLNATAFTGSRVAFTDFRYNISR